MPAKSQAESQLVLGVPTLEGQSPRSCRSLICLLDSLTLQVLRWQAGPREGAPTSPRSAHRPQPSQDGIPTPENGTGGGEVRGGKSREW